jgi:hypothetical protein
MWKLTWCNLIDFIGQKTTHTTGNNIVWLKKSQCDIFLILK